MDGQSEFLEVSVVYIVIEEYPLCGFPLYNYVRQTIRPSMNKPCDESLPVKDIFSPYRKPTGVNYNNNRITKDQSQNISPLTF